jgi:hypothetical protein
MFASLTFGRMIDERPSEELPLALDLKSRIIIFFGVNTRRRGGACCISSQVRMPLLVVAFLQSARIPIPKIPRKISETCKPPVISVVITKSVCHLAKEVPC